MISYSGCCLQVPLGQATRQILIYFLPFTIKLVHTGQFYKDAWIDFFLEVTSCLYFSIHDLMFFKEKFPSPLVYFLLAETCPCLDSLSILARVCVCVCVWRDRCRQIEHIHKCTSKDFPGGPLVKTLPS